MGEEFVGHAVRQTEGFIFGRLGKGAGESIGVILNERESFQRFVAVGGGLRFVEPLSAILLVGGKGSRMYPHTEPKCLADLNGKAMLFHIMEWLAKYVTGYTLCVGYQASQVIQACKRRYDSVGSNIAYSDAGEEASQGRRILTAAQTIRGRSLVCYGDEVAEVPVDKLLAFHKARKALVTITTYPMKSEFGIVETSKQGRVERLREKPVLDHKVNIGFQIWEKEAIQYLDGHDLPDALNLVAKKRRLYAYKFEGNRVTANTETERQRAEREMLDWGKREGVLAG